MGKGPLLEELCKRIPVFEIGDYQRLKSHIKGLLVELLTNRMFRKERDGGKKAQEIAKKLVEGYSYHGKAITKFEAEELGLKIEQLKDEEWSLVWDIFRIFESAVLVRGE